MNSTHQNLLRALVAAQVAVIEHADELLGQSPSQSKIALLKCLLEATKLGKILD